MNSKCRQDIELECKTCGRKTVLGYDLTIENASMHAEGYIEGYDYECAICEKKTEDAKAQADAEEEAEETLTDEEIQADEALSATEV